MYAVTNHYHLSIPVDQIRPRFEEAVPLVASMPPINAPQGLPTEPMTMKPRSATDARVV